MSGTSSELGPPTPSPRKRVCLPHRVHRVVTAAFWRTFHHEGKISLAGEGGGCTALCTPTPFHYFHHSKVAVYAPAEWADTLTLFHLYQYSICTLWSTPIVACGGGGGAQSTHRDRGDRGSVSALRAGAYATTLLVMVDRVKGGGRAPPPPPSTRLG